MTLKFNNEAIKKHRSKFANKKNPIPPHDSEAETPDLTITPICDTHEHRRPHLIRCIPRFIFINRAIWMELQSDLFENKIYHGDVDLLHILFLN